ncbi:MAG: alpha/beta hydrolase [Rickettsiaceae bacterium]|nr:alpha/beta hydrolase [Rickettsiaceae bacterium]
MTTHLTMIFHSKKETPLISFITSKTIYFLTLITLLFSVNLNIKAKSANKIQAMAKEHSFVLEEIDVGDFVITSYQKIQQPELKEVVFYIEGDGRAFSNGFPSEDPTPSQHLLFPLMTLDKRPNIIYLARPCQYTEKSKNTKCNNSFYWASGRLGEEVVKASKLAIDKIAQNKNYHLVGYSGGGGMAVLVSAIDSSKVLSITTIAGNLDLNKFKELHSIRPLFGPWKTYIDDSLNPLDYTDKLRHIKQIHFSGKKDTIVPPIIAENFVKKSNSSQVKQVIIPKADHVDNWTQVWNAFLLGN